MDNNEVRNKLERILLDLKQGKLTSQEAHEAMKPLNDLISKATTDLFAEKSITKK